MDARSALPLFHLYGDPPDDQAFDFIHIETIAARSSGHAWTIGAHQHRNLLQILAIDREDEVANCAVTSYEFDPDLGRKGKLALRLYNFVAPLEEAGEEVTRAPDANVAPR